MLGQGKIIQTYQKFIQAKTGSENGPFSEIGYLEKDLSQKSETYPNIKKYNVIFHTHFVANEFTRK